MPAALDLPNPLHPSFVDRLDVDFVEYYNKNIAIKPATHIVDLADVRQNPAKFAWHYPLKHEHWQHLQRVQLWLA
jgi:hypothetical protein